MSTYEDIVAALTDREAQAWQFPPAPQPERSAFEAAALRQRRAAQPGAREEGFITRELLQPPRTPLEYGLAALPHTRALGLGVRGATAMLGGLAAMDFADPAEARVTGVARRVGSLSRVNPAEVTAAARESAKGITYDELRGLYGKLGLTGGEPSELAQRSLAKQQSQTARQVAEELKLQDREMIRSMSPTDRRTFVMTGKMPDNMMLPSKEAAAPALEAFRPIKKEITAAEAEFDKNVARGIRPSIFDLSPKTLVKLPDVPQFPLPRVPPKLTERLQSASRGGLQRLERAAGEAAPEDWGWYNLMQTKDLFTKIHGPERGAQAFDAWLDGLAGTSMVNPIDNNIRSSTWYLQQILQGKPLPEVMSVVDPDTGKAVRTMVGGPPPGYGAKSQVQHADRVREYLTHSYDPVSNPKPISYRMNLAGNWMPRTVDTHDVRNMVGMPRALSSFGAEESSLLPGEYSYLENIGQRAAQRAKVPQASQQAATWIGGGQYTGLKSYPAPLLEALNRRAHVTAKVNDTTPMQALIDAFSGKRPLLSLGGASMVGAPVMGSLADQSRYD